MRRVAVARLVIPRNRPKMMVMTRPAIAPRTAPLDQNDAPHAHRAIDLGERNAPIEVRINRRARRLIVRVDALRGVVIVTAPSKRAIPEAVAFAQSRADWVRACFAEAGPPQPFVDGGVMPYRGGFFQIVNEGAPRAPVRMIASGQGQEKIYVGGDAAHVNRRVTDWLKKQARLAFTERTDQYANILNAKRGPISIRDPRSRWGSCASNGALSFSWRLIMAPPWVLDYVAAHECAHLLHLDHSPAFWKVVKDLGFDEPAARAWFRAHGEALHRWGRAA